VRSCGACGFEHLHGSDDVDCGVVLRPLDGGYDVGLRSEMEDDVGPRCVDPVADVALDEGRLRAQELALPSGEVVDHDDVVAPRDERVHQVGADEARSTGDDRTHGHLW
jgi:hypothetical protein